MRQSRTAFGQGGRDAQLPLAPGLSRDFLRYHRLCPKERRGDGTVVVAIAPNALIEGLDDVAIAYHAVVASEEATDVEVEQLIERVAGRAEIDASHAVSAQGLGDEILEDDLATDIRDLANQPPVVRYVNLLVRDAHDAGASDIHLEARRTESGRTLMVARVRIDGVLTGVPEPPPQLAHAVVSRIKLLAELDIAERRKPQDGRVRLRLETRELDLRISTVPTLFGESVVLRLLDRGGRPVELEELGMGPDLLSSVGRMAARPHGMFLVTGPTGSGKTTTLYSCLTRRDTGSEKIITVEDPVEYQLAGITQVPVHRQVGVTFASALRSILRQDPDVIMVGETRDTETAEIAAQAAMTGHLVFTTLHTNDAIGAVPRLLDLGIPEYLVAATVEGVLAQRLVRRVCDQCRESYQPSSETAALVAGHPVGRVRHQRGGGCAACRGTGYRGRVGLFELLVVDDEVRDAIALRVPRGALKATAIAAGMRPLRADGWAKIEAGLTTIEEVLRVLED